MRRGSLAHHAPQCPQRAMLTLAGAGIQQGTQNDHQSSHLSGLGLQGEGRSPQDTHIVLLEGRSPLSVLLAPQKGELSPPCDGCFAAAMRQTMETFGKSMYTKRNFHYVQDLRKWEGIAGQVQEGVNGPEPAGCPRHTWWPQIVTRGSLMCVP